MKLEFAGKERLQDLLEVCRCAALHHYSKNILELWVVELSLEICED